MKLTFRGSPQPTLGVELELQILDPETKNLVSGAPRILERMHKNAHVKPELLESTIELTTDVCANVPAVRRELGKQVGELLRVCDEAGYELASAGTHPFAKWSEQQITRKERYRMLVDRCQWPARRLVIFGLHVHVGVESGEKAIAVFKRLDHVPAAPAALSASSPFFTSLDTGLASSRVKIFESLPTAGLPYRLLNWAEFQRFMITLVNARAIESVREVWWGRTSAPRLRHHRVEDLRRAADAGRGARHDSANSSAGGLARGPIRRRHVPAAAAALDRARKQVACGGGGPPQPRSSSTKRAGSSRLSDAIEAMLESIRPVAKRLR